MTAGLVVTGLVVTGMAGIAGCSPGPSGPKSIAVTHYRGIPPGATPPRPVPSIGVDAGWRAGRLDVTTWGSGSCPAVPTRVRARGTHAVEVTISADYSGACTADMAPTTFVVELPSGIAAAGPLTVMVRGKERDPVTITVPRP